MTKEMSIKEQYSTKWKGLLSGGGRNISLFKGLLEVDGETEVN